MAAKQYYDSSYQIALRVNDPILIGNALNGLGSYYMTAGYSYYTLSEGEGEDSVIQLFHIAEERILEAINWFDKGQYLKGVALAYGNLSNINTVLENFDQALDYMYKAIAYFEKLNYDTYTVIGYWGDSGTEIEE